MRTKISIPFVLFFVDVFLFVVVVVVVVLIFHLKII